MIEFDAIHSESCKGLLTIDDKMVSPFGLDHDVIYVGLNGSPNEISETLEHAALVRSPHVL